jgi:hypothetical protein
MRTNCLRNWCRVYLFHPYRARWPCHASRFVSAGSRPVLAFGPVRRVRRAHAPQHRSTATASAGSGKQALRPKSGHAQLATQTTARRSQLATTWAFPSAQSCFWLSLLYHLPPWQGIGPLPPAAGRWAAQLSPRSRAQLPSSRSPTRIKTVPVRTRKRRHASLRVPSPRASRTSRRRFAASSASCCRISACRYGSASICTSSSRSLDTHHSNFLYCF